MNNVYLLIIYGCWPSIRVTAPLEITASPTRHKLSINFQSERRAEAGVIHTDEYR